MWMSLGVISELLFRRIGWSPLGVVALQVAKFHRDQRYRIESAYGQDGIVLSRVFQGSTDGTLFEDFIDQPLKALWQVA